MGYSPWGCTESDMTERLHTHTHTHTHTTGDERVWKGFRQKWDLNLNFTLKVRQSVVKKKFRARKDSRTAGGRPQGWKEPGGSGRAAAKEGKIVREDWKA